MGKNINPLDDFCKNDTDDELSQMFCTLTINPQLYHLEGSKQMDRSEEDLLNIFQIYKCTIIAEYTKQYNIHYHIITGDLTKSQRITLHKRVYKMINKNLNSIGRIFYIKRIFNLQKIIEYINKDIVRIYRDDMDYIHDKNSEQYLEYLARQQFEKEELIGMMKYL